MIHALSEGPQAVLQHFARQGALLALDYDGTLAPLVDDRTKATMREATQKLLAQLTRRMPTIFISGRARLDVLRFLGGVQPLEVIGNHGLESDGAAAAHHVQSVREWKSALVDALGSIPGLSIEDKRYSLAVHFRQCTDHAGARAAAQEAAARLKGARVVGGVYVVNVVPASAPNKGDALLAAMKRWNRPKAIFVGDDDTDEDVFRLSSDTHLLTVRVGGSPESAALYFLRDQEEVDVFLDVLFAAAGVPLLAGKT